MSGSSSLASYTPSAFVHDLSSVPLFDFAFQRLEPSPHVLLNQTEEYVQALSFIAVWPLLLPLLYVILECALLCACCGRRSAAAPPSSDSRERCEWWCSAGCLVTGFAVVAWGVVANIKVGEATSIIITDLQQTVSYQQALYTIGQAAHTRMSGVISSLSVILAAATQPLPVEVQQMAFELPPADGDCLEFMDRVCALLPLLPPLLSSISISLAEALSILQSVDSIREVVCFTLAAVLFAALFLLWFSHSCSRRANCCTSLSSVMAVVLYVLVSLVATVTLASTVFIADLCMDPHAYITSISEQTMDSTDQAIVQRYVYCAPEDPLSSLLGSAFNTLNTTTHSLHAYTPTTTTTTVGELVLFASSQQPALLQQCTQWGETVEETLSFVAESQSQLSCAAVSSDWSNSTMQLCSPLLIHLFSLMIAQVVASLCLLGLRHCLSTPCYLCTADASFEDGVDEDGGGDAEWVGEGREGEGEGEGEEGGEGRESPEFEDVSLLQSPPSAKKQKARGGVAAGRGRGGGGGRAPAGINAQQQGGYRPLSGGGGGGGNGGGRGEHFKYQQPSRQQQQQQRQQQQQQQAARVYVQEGEGEEGEGSPALQPLYDVAIDEKHAHAVLGASRDSKAEAKRGGGGGGGGGGEISEEQNARRLAVDDWQVAEVQAWLRFILLDEYQGVFGVQRVTGRDLIGCSDRFLRRTVGMHTDRHREILLEARTALLDRQWPLKLLRALAEGTSTTGGVQSQQSQYTQPLLSPHHHQQLSLSHSQSLYQPPQQQQQQPALIIDQLRRQHSDVKTASLQQQQMQQQQQQQQQHHQSQHSSQSAVIEGGRGSLGDGAEEEPGHISAAAALLPVGAAAVSDIDDRDAPGVL